MTQLKILSGKRKNIIMLSIIILLLLTLVLPLFITGILYEKFFGHRTVSTTFALTPTMEEYPELVRKQVKFPSSKGQILTGYLYDAKEKSDNKDAIKGLIVLAHGIGVGHIDYLEEINYLCSNGYTVLGFDNTGCNESEGNSMVGLVQSSIDLDYALRYVESNDSLKILPILLYGHSWGGYASCAVLNYNHRIKAVVSRSGFNRSQDILLEGGVQMYGDWIRIISPYMYLYEKIKFGKATDQTAEKGIKNSTADILILYGDQDKVISMESSIYHLFEKDKQNNVTTTLYHGKGHDVVLSDEAMQYLEEKGKEKTALIKKHNGKVNVSEKEWDSFYDSYDRKKMRKLDGNIMKEIVDFYDKAIT